MAVLGPFHLTSDWRRVQLVRSLELNSPARTAHSSHGDDVRARVRAQQVGLYEQSKRRWVAQTPLHSQCDPSQWSVGGPYGRGTPELARSLAVAEIHSIPWS